MRSEGWGPDIGAPNFGEPKISLFFLPLPTPISFFLPSWGSFRGILVVFEAPGVLGLSCEAPALRKFRPFLPPPGALDLGQFH